MEVRQKQNSLKLELTDKNLLNITSHDISFS